MSIQSDLLGEIEAFLPTMGVAESTFGRLAVNDGKFIARLRRADNMTLSTLERARAFLDSERSRKTEGHADSNASQAAA